MELRNLLLGLFSLSGLMLSVSGARINRRSEQPRSVPPSHGVHERHEYRHLEGWVKRDLVDADATIPVRIGLRQSNVDVGHDLLTEM